MQSGVIIISIDLYQDSQHKSSSLDSCSYVSCEFHLHWSQKVQLRPNCATAGVKQHWYWSETTLKHLVSNSYLTCASEAFPWHWVLYTPPSWHLQASNFWQKTLGWYRLRVSQKRKWERRKSLLFHLNTKVEFWAKYAPLQKQKPNEINLNRRIFHIIGKHNLEESKMLLTIHC